MLNEIPPSTLYRKLSYLIIDDFDQFRISLQKQLESLGATKIVSVATAQEAISKCQFEYFDVIICDFNLGPGMNGQHILESLRANKRLKNTHLFIMLSAETARDVVLGAREHEPDGYIAKPITRATLETRLNALQLQQAHFKNINRELDLDNYSKAVTLCFQLMEVEPKYRAKCLRMIADLYRKMGDLASAEKTYKDVLKSRELPWARLGLGQVYLQAHRFNEAKNCFTRVLNEHNNLTEAYDGLALAHLKLNEHEAAQKVLEHACKLSPRLVSRQELLGRISIDNQNLETASKAYRQAKNYGKHSIHANSSTCFELSKCLSELSRNNQDGRSIRYAEEALNTLNYAKSRFRLSISQDITSKLIEARVYSSLNNEEQAKNSLELAKDAMSEQLDEPSLNIELAKTLYQLGQKDESQELLVKITSDANLSTNAMREAQSLIDEPEDLVVKKKARNFNKNAIALADSENYQEAIQSFLSAIALTPQHAALNLNFAQVCLDQYHKQQEEQLLNNVEEALRRLEHLPPSHHQFKRLRYVYKKFLQVSKRQLTLNNLESTF